MSRRFAIDQTDMRVFINGNQLHRFHMDLEFRFPKDGIPARYSGEVGQDGWGTEKLPGGQEVRWWIGFHPEAIGRGILARYIYHRATKTPPKTLYV